MALFMAATSRGTSSALLKAAKRVTTWPPTALLAGVFNRSVMNPAAAPAPAASVGRFSSSSIYSDSGSESDEYYVDGYECTIIAKGGHITRSDKFDIKQGYCDPYMRNPFQTAGPKGAYEVKQMEGGIFLRMEMPGIEKEDLKIWVEDDDTVYVKGGGGDLQGNKDESTDDDAPRAYYAKVMVPTDGVEIDKMEAEIKNGVLQLLIPKSKDQDDQFNKKLEIKIK